MRGDLVTIAMQGDFGKPRPALIMQADAFNAHATVTVLLVTSTLVAAPLLRIPVQPNAVNGLQKSSQVMVDKLSTLPRARISEPFGRLDDERMRAISRALLLVVGAI